MTELLMILSSSTIGKRAAALLAVLVLASLFLLPGIRAGGIPSAAWIEVDLTTQGDGMDSTRTPAMSNIGDTFVVDVTLQIANPELAGYIA
jgi:hypothetical protein